MAVLARGCYTPELAWADILFVAGWPGPQAGRRVQSRSEVPEPDLSSSSARRAPVSSLDTYDCWLRGFECLKRGTVEADAEARTYFERALETDPSYARGYTGSLGQVDLIVHDPIAEFFNTRGNNVHAYTAVCDRRLGGLSCQSARHPLLFSFQFGV